MGEGWEGKCCFMTVGDGHPCCLLLFSQRFALAAVFNISYILEIGLF